MKRSRTGIAALLLAGGALVGAPGAARAYVDGARFAEPATEGGGGGRLFTGAPGDGYTCVVCHGAGSTFAPTVTGIPEDGWRPGETYELAIAFPEGPRNVGAVLEIADERGRGSGTLELVPDAQQEADDQCRLGGPAMVDASTAGRLVARAEVCGARRARVRWTAPPSPVASLRLFASVVAADDSGDPSGDSTGQLERPLRALGGADLEGARLAQACSARQGRRGVALEALLGVLALGALAVRRRAR